MKGKYIPALNEIYNRVYYLVFPFIENVLPHLLLIRFASKIIVTRKMLNIVKRL